MSQLKPLYSTERKEYIYDEGEDPKYCLGGVESLIISEFDSAKKEFKGSVQLVDRVEEIEFELNWIAESSSSNNGFKIRPKDRDYFTMSLEFNELIEKYILQSINEYNSIDKSGRSE